MTQNLSKPEPLPIPNDNPSVHDLVIQDILDRKQMGFEKYGTYLRANNGRKALIDLYQELLDAVCYIRQEIEDRQNNAS